MAQKTLITEEERLLFRDAVKNVKPLLSNGNTQPPLPSLKKAHNRKLAAAIVTQHQQDKPVYPLLEKQLINSPTPVSAEESMQFARSGLQVRTLQRLKRGEFVIEAVLDLHGFKVVEAEQILDDFLTQAIQNHWRHVLIIHGKGNRSGQGPVLKNSVNQWLRAYPIVLAFCSAKVSEGGVGAIYVLLKNPKNNF